MPSNDTAVSVRNLTKIYRIFAHPGDRLKQAMAFGLKRYHKEFTALEDVSFDVKKGEMIGIIGRNGSGKSTLLQLICGILKPTSGTVQVNGRVSALLELGAGFNPEFTGRENVYFQGAVIGITKAEMDDRFDGIAAFADIGDFIDQPVRMYSSGMYLRLAFATAVNVDSEILVVDEALAVGDAGFRSRCFRRIGELRSAGCTVIFVSHALEEISRLCGRALLIDEGDLLLVGRPKFVVGEFQRLLGAGPDERRTMRDQIRKMHVDDSEDARYSFIPANAGSGSDCLETYDPGFRPESTVAYDSNGAVIESARVLTASGQRVNVLRSGEKYRIVYRAHFTENVANVRCAILIKTLSGVDLGGAMSAPTPAEGIPSVAQGEIADVEFEFNCTLNSGVYLLNVAVFVSVAGVEYIAHGVVDAEIFRVTAGPNNFAISTVDFGCRATIHMIASVVS